jgi:23S rRNA pseudouridine2605 synthase
MVHNSDSDQKPPFRQDKKPYEKREGGFGAGKDDKPGFKKSFGDKPGGPKGAKGAKDDKGKFGDKPFKPKDIQDQKTGERIAKVLARAGLASRREVERLIGLGKIAVNGRILDTPAMLVTPEDIVTVDGQVIGAKEPTRLWRYHKPVGLMTTHKDPQGRPTVFDDLPKDLPRVISVGRLDLNSEGLLLLTNDGELARALEMPSSGWVRRYRARAHGAATQGKLDTLKDGITVEGVTYGPIEAHLDKAVTKADGRSNNWISVSLTEGKNREVRKVLGALELQVNRLIRMAYGPFLLGDLALGAVEEIGPRVIRELLADIVPLHNLPPEGASQTRSGFKPRSDAAPGRRGGGDRFKDRGDGPKEFKPRGEGKPFDRSAPKRDFKPRSDGARPEGRPFEKRVWSDRSDASADGEAPKRSFKPRSEGGGSFGKPRGAPRSDGPRPEGRPYVKKTWEGRGDKPEGGDAPKREFKPRSEGGGSFGKPRGGASGGGAAGAKRDVRLREGASADGFRGSGTKGDKPKSFAGKPGGFKSGGGFKGKPSGGPGKPRGPKA